MQYLGVDFGLRRVGLAQSAGSLASPLQTIDVKGSKDAIVKVSQFAEHKGFNKIIVGLPEGKIRQTVLGFINGLKKMGFDVETMDETLSSQRATEEMIRLNIPKQKRHRNDAYSAAIILQNYLER